MTLWAAAGEEDDYAIRLWNPGAERVYGHTAEHALGKSYIDLFVNPRERERAISDHARIVKTGEAYDWDWAADDITADGSVRTMLTHCFRIEDPDDGSWLLAEIGVDISDFNRASQQLRAVREDEYRRQEMNLARSIGGIGQAVAEMGGNGTFSAVVSAVMAAARGAVDGVAQSAVIFLGAEKYGPEGKAASVENDFPFDLDSAVEDVFKRDGSIYYDFHDRSGPGAKYAVPGRRGSKRSFVVIKLLGIQTRPLGALAIALSTGRAFKEGERERLETLAAFAGPLVSVARELQRTQEYQNHRIAAEQQELIFKLVLHTVGNEALLLRGTTDELKRALEGVDIGSQARDLLGRLEVDAEQLNSSLVRLRKQVTAKNLIDSAIVINEVNAVVNPYRARFPEVNIVVNIDPSHRSLISPIWVQQAVQNIVQNALSILRDTDGGGDVRITSSRGPGGEISVYVEDSGPGVDETIRGTLFDDGVSRRTGGTGQGLHLTRDLIRPGRGDIVLLPSNPHGLGGAIFRIDLPPASADEIQRDGSAGEE